MRPFPPSTWKHPRAEICTPRPLGPDGGRADSFDSVLRPVVQNEEKTNPICATRYTAGLRVQESGLVLRH